MTRGYIEHSNIGDTDAGCGTLIKPTPPMVDKVVQEASLGEDSKLTGVIKSVIDKDGEDYMMYEINIK